MRTGTITPISISSGARNDEMPLDFDLLKTHLAITNSDLDDLISLWELAAVEWAEEYMSRSIMERQSRFVISDFPRCGGYGAIKLPMGRTIAVNSIEYSTGGRIVTLYGPTSGSPGASDFQEDLSDDSGGIVMPRRGNSWPSVDCDVPAPVAINITAGWSAVEDVPVGIKHALMFAVADLLELRSSNDLSAQVANSGSWLSTRQALLSSWVVRRVY